MAVQLENDVFIKACFCRKTERTPVWLMRQAGRYSPEYRNTRSKAGSFLDLATVKLADASSLDGHIFNLGRVISQFTLPENVAALVSKVRQCSTDLRLGKV